MIPKSSYRRALPYILLVCAALLGLAAINRAYPQSAAPPRTAAATPKPQPAAAPVPDQAPPPLDELDRTRLELYNLKFQLLQQQQQQLQGAYAGFVQGLNAQHPGWLFNPQLGQFAKAPAPKPDAAAVKKP